MNIADIAWIIDAVIVSGWLLLCVTLPRVLRALPRPCAPPLADPLPRVSVIVPARNEERLLARCLASIAGQRFPIHEIIVVDDDSDDATAVVAARFGVRVVAAGSRPPEWAGKPWAAHRGAIAATGDRLLFVDADAVLAPSCVATAVREAEAGAVDLLAFLHRPDCGSTFEAIVQPVFTLALFLSADLARINDPSSKVAAAPGSFLLFRRTSYERLGGHHSVRGAIVEDLELARTVKAHGLTLRVLAAPDLIFTERPRTPSQICDGWIRVTAGATHDAPASSVAAAVALLAVFAGPLLLAPVGTPFAALALAHAVATRIVRAQMNSAIGLDSRSAWLQPLGALIAAALLVRASLAVAGANESIRWSGRHYKP